MDKAKAKKLIITLMSAFIIVYIVYVGISTVFDVNGIETEIATEMTATDSLYKEAIIVREEKLVKNKLDGVISYVANDGDHVAKGEVIASLYKDEKDVINNKKLDDINEEIIQIKKLNASASTGDLAIDNINSQINNAIISMNSSIADRDFINTESYIDDLTYLITERHVVTNNAVNVSKRLNELEAEKTQLESETTKATGHIKAKKAGCFVSSADGYENVYSYENVKSININKFNEMKDEKPKKLSEKTVGKLITNVEWYVVCPVSSQDALRITTSGYQKVIINMPYATTASIPAYIEAVNPDPTGDGDSVMVLRCDYMNSELASVRNENIEICLSSFEGIRVSKRAIHDGIVKKISEDKDGNQLTKKKKVQGVYVLYGNELQFKEISIVYSGSDFVICDPSPDEGKLFNGRTVELYDNIVVEGDDLKDGKVIK